MDRRVLEDEFVAKLRAAWERGAKEYGDQSFANPPSSSVEEMLQELVDVAGWAFVAWVSLKGRLEHYLSRIKAEAVTSAEAAPPVLPNQPPCSRDSTTR
jgi:hypothetical protein